MSETVIRTMTGVYVDLADPLPESICLQDIAWHLSQVNRFTGATFRPYSVLEHSVYVARLCSEPHRRVAAMHDAPEAYLGDVTSPLKKLIGEFYRPLEARFWKVIATKFDLPLEIPDEVHEVDKRILLDEQRDLTAPPREQLRNDCGWAPMGFSIPERAPQSYDLICEWLRLVKHGA